MYVLIKSDEDNPSVTGSAREVDCLLLSEEALIRKAVAMSGNEDLSAEEASNYLKWNGWSVYKKVLFSDSAAREAKSPEEEREAGLENLVRVANYVMAIGEDESLSWEQRYDKLFDGSKRMSTAADAIGWSFDYWDPDMDYQDDVLAYCRAVKGMREEATIELVTLRDLAPLRR